MDKYGFNIEVEQIRKMVNRGGYETAMRITDTINQRKMRNVNILSMVATIYEKDEEYQEVKDILLLTFEQAPIGKHLLFKPAELAIKEGSFQGAEDYYREFCDLAPGDPRQCTLRYPILRAKGVSAEQLIYTLEQYCNVELDEKWIYELAELYAEAGIGKLCTITYDKIMLMFGLEKYMEKAMKLRIQSAPLTKYQMDLAENRGRYEARLEAVEQEYRARKRPADYEPVSEKKTEVSPQSYTARREAVFAAEPEAEYPRGGYSESGYAESGHREDGYAKDGYAEDECPNDGCIEDGCPESGYAEDGYAEEKYTERGHWNDRYTQNKHQDNRYIETRCPKDDCPECDYQKSGCRVEAYQEDSHTDEGGSEEVYTRQGRYGNEYPDQNVQEGTQDGTEAGYPEGHRGIAAKAEEPYEDEGTHTRVTIKSEGSDGGEGPLKESQSQWMPDKLRILPDEAVRARMHETEVQANLAEEMSRISDEHHRSEITSTQTRVLADIKDLGRESSIQEFHHFMIEAGYSNSDLDQAIEPLKKIHKEARTKNQAAKITGGKFNGKGVFAIVNKLTNKDLIIEQTGVMKESTLQELNQLMTRDGIDTNVVPIDVAGSLVHIHRVYPGLTKRFGYVGKIGSEEAAYVAPEGDDRSVRSVQLREAEEAVAPRTALRRIEESTAGKVQPIAKPAATRSLLRPETGQKSAAECKAGTEQKPRPEHRRMEKSCPEPVAPREGRKEVSLKAAEAPPVLPQPEEPDYDDQQKVDIDEFAQYTRRYVNDTDCSISGKSVLTFYERIEIMEEDGVPLTKVDAEDPIEEAADKAGNPSFIKRVTGIFSPKYDGGGFLILREEYFI